MSEAIKFTRQWLTEHYEPWIQNAKEDEEELEESYGKKHWDESTLEWLCKEIHQIIYDECADGIIAVAKYFVELGRKEGSGEVLEMFSHTEEHSH